MSAHASGLSPRMELILGSATVVVAQKGMRGLTHRAVDAAADLPVGSTSGYLRTRLALTTALAEFISAHLTDSIEQLVGRQRAGATEEVLIEDAIDIFVTWLQAPNALLAHGELAQEATRVPQVAEALEPSKRRLEGIVEELLATAGVEGDVRGDAQAVIAAMNGVLLTALSRPVDDREAYVRGVAHRIITAFMSLPEIADRPSGPTKGAGRFPSPCP